MPSLIKRAILHPIRTGSIAPSSKRLVDRVLELADIKAGERVIELGAGTGAFTRRIVEEVSDYTLFFALEIDEKMAKETQAKIPNATIYPDSATNIDRYLEQRGFNGCEVIISSLPWVGMKESIQDLLLREIFNALNDSGRFLTIAYIHGISTRSGKRFRGMLEERFDGRVYRIGPVRQNLPPSYIYHCKK